MSLRKFKNPFLMQSAADLPAGRLRIHKVSQSRKNYFVMLCDPFGFFFAALCNKLISLLKKTLTNFRVKSAYAFFSVTT
jgi:hypothetical protein